MSSGKGHAASRTSVDRSSNLPLFLSNNNIGANTWDPWYISLNNMSLCLSAASRFCHCTNLWLPRRKTQNSGLATSTSVAQFALPMVTQSRAASQLSRRPHDYQSRNYNHPAITNGMAVRQYSTSRSSKTLRPSKARGNLKGIVLVWYLAACAWQRWTPPQSDNSELIALRQHCIDAHNRVYSFLALNERAGQDTGFAKAGSRLCPCCGHHWKNPVKYNPVASLGTIPPVQS